MTPIAFSLLCVIYLLSQFLYKKSWQKKWSYENIDEVIWIGTLWVHRHPNHNDRNDRKSPKWSNNKNPTPFTNEVALPFEK